MEAEKAKKAKLNGKQKAIIISAAALLLAAIGVIVFFLFVRKPTSATTMRILRYEGSVSLFDNDKENTLMENMLLHSGNALATQDKSYIDISLDDSKVVGLDEASRAEFNQSGKKLDISLVNGGLYFYTTEKLKDDETFDIRTSTMIIGIRGTSGYVRADEETGVTTLQLTSGKVHVEGTNPATGGKREADITAGQSVQTYFYNDRQGEDSIEFVIDSFDEEDLPVYFVKSLVAQPDVLKEVVEQCGFSEEKLKEIAQTDTAEADEEEDSEEQNEEAEDAEEEPEEEEAEEDAQEVLQGNQQANAEDDPAAPAVTKATTVAANAPETNTDDTNTPAANTGNTDNNSTDPNPSNEEENNNNTESDTYTVTADTATGGTIAASPSDAKEGDVVTLTATPQSGYELDAWSVTDSSGNAITVSANSADNTATFTMPAGNVSVRATFKEITAATYSVSTTTAIGGTVTASPSDAKEGDVVTLTATPQSGYELDAWSVTDSSGNAITVSANSADNTATFTMPAGNVSVRATFKEITAATYSVSITTATGGTVTASLSDAKEGDVVTLTATPQSGYELDAWSVKDSGGNAIAVGALSVNGTSSTATFTMPAGNVTVTATFQQLATYGVTVASGITGGRIAASVASAVRGAVITLTATPETGYELKAWLVRLSNGSSLETKTTPDDENKATFTMPEGDVTVSATMQKKSYNIKSGTTTGLASIQFLNAEGQEVVTAQMGDTVTVLMELESGLRIDELTIKNAEGATVSHTAITSDSSSGYKKASFTMPASDVTVSVTTKEAVFGISLPTEIATSVPETARVSVEFEAVEVYENAVVSGTISYNNSYFTSFDVKVKKSDGEVVESEYTDNRLIFSMPDDDVTICLEGVVQQKTLTLESTLRMVTEASPSMSEGVYYASSGSQVKIAALSPDSSGGVYFNSALGIYASGQSSDAGAADILYSYEGDQFSVGLLNAEGTRIATLADDNNDSTYSATLPRDESSGTEARLKLIWNKNADRFTLGVTENP